jgi:MtN3 and saliva related transmembrane protein
MTMLDYANFLGLSAGTLTTAAFVPQALKIWQSKSAADVSYGMFFIFSTGVFLWLLYGIAIGAAPVIIANVITLALAILIIILKIKYR